MHLLERETDLAAIETAMRASSLGRGTVVMVSGPAGIGKTSLIDAATMPVVGLRRLAARGGELESDLALGVVRDLLAPLLAGDGEAVRRRRLDGTGPAGPVLAGHSDAATEPQALPAGLHRLVVNVAEERPLLLVVDDVQWADGASVRFLAYLARRIAHRPVALLLGRRSDEAAVDEAALRSIVEEPIARELQLAPLSLPAVAGLVRQHAGPAVGEPFCRACHTATGGNPFLLGQVLEQLGTTALPPGEWTAAMVADANPPAVERWVLGRLERLGAEAVALAGAVAILGHDADLRRAALLEELSVDAAERALDALAARGLLEPGRPLNFVHPLVRAAVYGALPPGGRSRLHRRAAALLREDGAPADVVAAHLLACEPGGEAWVAGALLEGARAALARGAPELARAHLLRALDEGPPAALRPAIRRGIGHAERRLGLGTAEDRFSDALAELGDPRERGRTVLEMVIAADVVRDDVVALIERTIGEVAPVDRGLALMLRAQLLLQLELARQPLDRELRMAEQELADRPEDTAGTRMLAAMLARHKALRACPRPAVLALALRAVGDDERYAAALDADQPLIYAITALGLCDELALAERRATQAIERAERRGSLVGQAIPLYVRAYVRLRAGAVAAAVADALRALELARDGSAELLTVTALGVYLEALLERGDVDTARGLLAERRDPAAMWSIGLARSLLYLRSGEAARAYAEARAVGDDAEPRGLRHPVILPWRSRAALALLALDRPQEAVALAHEELAIAQAAELQAATGTAYRILGLATGGPAGTELLEQAVALLESSPAPIELARALTDLGAGLRRAGRRRAAREPLTRALELAHRHGAVPLADTARQELTATGARPRRIMRSGVDALTPSERRVAEAAAQGLTNRQIAHELFIATKTVEHHLAATYRKLDITSRRALAERLREGSADPTPAGSAE